LWPHEQPQPPLPSDFDKLRDMAKEFIPERALDDEHFGAWDSIFVDESPAGFVPSSALELSLELNSSSGTGKPTADFFSNRMYDNNPWMPDEFGPLLSIQSAMFRWLSAASYRAGTPERLWCYSTWKYSDSDAKAGKGWVEGEALDYGRPYNYADFRAFVIHLLQLYRAMNFDPECAGMGEFTEDDKTEFSLDDDSDELREQMRLQRQKKIETSPLFKLEDLMRKQHGQPEYDWWGDEFLPALVEAFSCGFGDSDKTKGGTDPDRKISYLPIDIRTDFEKDGTNHFLPKVWRLMKGYLASPQKQRENVRWQNDFAVSLYVPFMRKHITYDLCPTTKCFTKRAMMRCGAPTYVGPSIWYVFHTMAHAIAVPFLGDNSGTACGAARTMLFEKFKTMMTFFAVSGQPCPYCREHFLTSVSRNDRFAKTYVGKDEPESNQYPLEWLFIGSEARVIGVASATPEYKLSTIDPAFPDSIKLFFWKLHNAVTSSVTWGKDCRDSEQYDEDVFKCTKGAKPQIGRTFPFARRFAFFLPTDEWEKIRMNGHVVDAMKELDALDKAALRGNMWMEQPKPVSSDVDQTGSDDSSEDPFDTHRSDIEKVIEATKKLDEEMLKSRVLDEMFGGGVPASAALGECTAVKGYLEAIFTFTEAPGRLLQLPGPCIDLVHHRNS